MHASPHMHACETRKVEPQDKDEERVKDRLRAQGLHTCSRMIISSIMIIHSDLSRADMIYLSSKQKERVK